MKKLLLAFIAMLFIISCKKEIELKDDYGSIIINPQLVSTNNLDKKDAIVNRGSIPVYVSEINVETFNTNGNTNNNFQLVDDGGESGFTINKLPLGETRITAQSLSSSDRIHNLTHFASSTEADDFVNNTNPYIVYKNINEPIINIELNSMLETDVEMETDNGRISIVFSTEESASLLDNYLIEIDVQKDGSDILTEQLASSGSILYYWSDEECIDGSLINVSIKWVDKTDSNVIVREELLEYTIQKGISLRNKISIKENSIDESNTNLSFIFNPISEINNADINYGEDIPVDIIDTVINLNFLLNDDVVSRLIGLDGSVSSQTMVGEFTWYANDMVGSEEVLLSESNFNFDIDAEQIRLSIYLRKDSITTYRTVNSNEDFTQLKIDYSDYYIRNDYTRSTLWGNNPVNYLLRIGDDADTIQKSFKINRYTIE